MAYPFAKHAAEVLFIQRNDEIQTLASYGPHQPLTKCVRFRRLRRSSQHSQSESPHQFLVELRREDRIAIMDEKAGHIIAGQGFPKLLQGPFSRRMSRRVALQNPSRSWLSPLP